MFYITKYYFYTGYSVFRYHFLQLKKNTDVTAAIKKVAEQFHVEPLEGVLSHEMKKFVIDGQKVIINKATQEHKVEEFEFQDYEVYAVDIVMSTGEGKVCFYCFIHMLIIISPRKRKTDQTSTRETQTKPTNSR